MKILISVVVVCLFLSGCVNTKAPISERRIAINTMQYEVLNDLYAQKPTVRSQVNDAVGYAVFDNANVNVILASFGGGYGVVNNNRNGKRTYMKMAEAGVGFGAGVKDFRIVMIFHSQSALNRFINEGWAFGAQADAAAKAGSKGAATGAEATIDNNITIYQMTEAGIALQATIKGTRFWQDEELN